MKEKIVVVPEGMLKAIYTQEVPLGFKHPDARRVLEAALSWLDEELRQMSLTYKIQQDKRGYPLTGDAERLSGFCEAMDRIRRLFVAPEPKVPEAIKDLVEGMSWESSTWKLILEAFRRGRNSK